MKTNQGFGCRVFLTKIEWQTYLKRMPVRYIKKKKENLCEICGKKPTKENPFESSHIIAFRTGIVDFALTPDFLDKDSNIVTAHKRICNQSAEIDKSEICKRLINLGISDLPKFLPKDTLNVWNQRILNSTTKGE